MSEKETEITPTRPELFTVGQFAERHKWLKLSTLRNILAKRKANGLDKAICKLGKKILINEDLFFEWFDAQSAD